jgi:hypothetical protein
MKSFQVYIKVISTVYFEHNKPENTPVSRYCAVLDAKHFWNWSLDTKGTNIHSEFLIFLHPPFPVLL